MTNDYDYEHKLAQVNLALEQLMLGKERCDAIPAHVLEAHDAFMPIKQLAETHDGFQTEMAVGLVLAIGAASCHPSNQVEAFLTNPRASLNLFHANIGPTGSGKSKTLKLVESLIDYEATKPARLTIGSGEGLVDAFLEPDPDAKIKGKVLKADPRLLAVLDEGETLDVHKQRNGTTLEQTIRSMFSSEFTGSGNTDAGGNKRQLDPMTYSLGLTVGFQPKLAQFLINQDASSGGTPQRFLFLGNTAVDPAEDALDDVLAYLAMSDAELEAELAERERKLPGGPTRIRILDGLRSTTFAIDPEIKKLYAKVEKIKSIGIHDEDRSQLPVLVLKVAAVLTFLDGDTHISWRNFTHAQTICSVSDATRKAVQSVVIEDTQSEQDPWDWYCEAIQTKFNETPANRTELSRAVNKTTLKNRLSLTASAAITELIACGFFKSTEDDKRLLTIGNSNARPGTTTEPVSERQSAVDDGMAAFFASQEQAVAS